MYCGHSMGLSPYDTAILTFTLQKVYEIIRS